MESATREIPSWKRSPVWPPNWPIRVKLTAVSAGITFVVLVLFGLGVGQLATSELRENFRQEARDDARALAEEIFREGALTPSAASNGLRGILDRRSDGAEVLLLANGLTFRSPGSPSLGTWSPSKVVVWEGFQVATVKYPPAAEGVDGRASPIALVRVGRNLSTLDRTINTVWLSIVGGILAASLLAGLAATILSGRALRPLARLTGAAGEVARTRDPGVSLPEPDGEDEVVELTRSFNRMLSELSAARSERIAALTRQREFVADASHELRTPLTSVLANLELLAASDALESDGVERESLDSALRSSRRMGRLVADLQILARADAGNAGHREQLELDEIAAAVVAEVIPLAPEHPIELDCKRTVAVFGVRDDIHRAVLNLVENAVRHTPVATEIQVDVGLEPATGTAFVEVSDRGPGIDPELKERIFDRFVRDTAAADRTAGASTGLGLSIVSAIARQHGGRATVTERPGGGSTFRLEFPNISSRREEKTPV